VLDGAIAQLGERCNRTAEVVGSIPTSSTNPIKHLQHSQYPVQPEIQPEAAPNRLPGAGLP
jgi:hypothetical protein